MSNQKLVINNKCVIIWKSQIKERYTQKINDYFDDFVQKLIDDKMIRRIYKMIMMAKALGL